MGDWLREQRRLGAVARALLGHAAARVALHERPRARPRHRLLRRARGALGRAPGGPAPALRRRGRLPVPARAARACSACPRSSTCGSTRARCPSPSTTRRSRTRSASRRATRRTSSARRWTRRAAGSTRCWPSACCSSIARRTRPSSASGLILDADGQKMSKSKGNIVVPWDVIDRFGADAFRWYFFTSKQPWDGYRFNVDTIGEVDPAVPAPAVEHLRLPDDLRARATRARHDRARPLDPVAAERDGRAGRPSASTPSTRPSPGARSPTSSTTSPTGTCAARGGASGRATARPSPRCASAS